PFANHVGNGERTCPKTAAAVMIGFCFMGRASGRQANHLQPLQMNGVIECGIRLRIAHEAVIELDPGKRDRSRPKLLLPT
ncbi:MAG: hypothetical protein ACR2RV_21850, partial [Verrucomicrobiales bacterium]